MLDASQSYLPDINDHWSSCDNWCPKESRHVCGGGGLVKCLGLIAGVFFARLTTSLCSLLFALARSFVTFACFFGKPPSSGYANKALVSFAACLSFFFCASESSLIRPVINPLTLGQI